MACLSRFGIAASVLLSVCAAPRLCAQAGARRTKSPAQWTTTLQTGIADTFQLTLGGAFGRGPAWQSRTETGVAHVFTQGDVLYLCGAESLDLDAQASNWQSGFEYRRPLWSKGRRQLSGTLGMQHWKFAQVKMGTNDWLTHENLTFRSAAGPVGFTATSDSYTLLKSPLAKGTLLHSQLWVEHTLLKREPVSLLFRHGPAHTYSWNFYGTHGHRIVRYQTMVSVVVRRTRFDVGYRQQIGLQPGVPDNRFWQFAVSRTWSR